MKLVKSPSLTKRRSSASSRSAGRPCQKDQGKSSNLLLARTEQLGLLLPSRRSSKRRSLATHSLADDSTASLSTCQSSVEDDTSSECQKVSPTIISVIEGARQDHLADNGNDCDDDEGSSANLVDRICCSRAHPYVETRLREETEDDCLHSCLHPDIEVSLCQTEATNKLQSRGWELEPLLLVATSPSMKVRKIRKAHEPSYFETRDVDTADGVAHTTQLPINNGKEKPLHSWVIDFESDFFMGTALFRIRGSKGRSDSQCSDHDYFANFGRKFQMVIRGKFKSKVHMTDCHSGLLLQRRLVTSKHATPERAELPFIFEEEASGESLNQYEGGDQEATRRKRRFNRKGNQDTSVPPKWVIRASVKAARLFSPRLDADLECSHPRILSPLCSAAQTLIVTGGGRVAPPIDSLHIEPNSNSESSLVGELTGFSPLLLDDGVRSMKADDIRTASLFRKRAFDTVFDRHAESLGRKACPSSPPCFDLKKEYTFEFLQHLVDYNDLSLDLGSLAGKMKIGGALKGQPVRLCAVTDQGSRGLRKIKGGSREHEFLWAFDIWHRSLVP
ncbi:hypothetical protein THAOC_00152 [Thalassiosira oceanica]|uniref:Domain of unknown function at the cortex 1 domain-containing protein n=1 Tax=Thalassiosira oceanica TaxID=159749 RepID=K0TPI8_THAOC|nr:hypothetical protein THAOC_00152 [Thalassiosira oceanica]|mmetsp:Transcript_11140/g.25987  ORF Transcript_11140/g.25987 Transcript_11140/m.25987 type:complete len:561 (+) Transcript_11140:133-1815(+)|eukprot:EJK77976.1 hypothetical protein THAOC_00152 [Thalassiosira oceanica]